MNTLERNSDSVSEESEYKSEEISDDESNDSVPESVVTVARGSSEIGDSKGKQTADNAFENGNGKKKGRSFDLKSKGLQSASSSRISLKANGAWKKKSSKREFPRLKEELRKLDLLDLEEKLISDERAVALEERLRMQKISNLKVAMKRLKLEKEILMYNLEKLQREDV